MRVCAFANAFTLLAFLSTAAHGQSTDRGRVFAQTHCASCHAIDKTGDSPFSGAPPLRTLHKRYRVENLAEALAEGISTGHPAMPEFTLTPRQIGDLLSFLKTLE
jgi:mono/diheme cytochrome c family protein